MVIIKNYYYLYIEDLQKLDFRNFKYKKKICIIFRNFEKYDIKDILKFRNDCKIKGFKFFVANDHKLANICRADGLYLSSYNKNRSYINLPKIGSAHNIKQINEKIIQNCETIIFSRLFKTQKKKGFLGVLKFNLFRYKIKTNLVPLGGINFHNLLKLNLVKCNGFAILSALKKKPAISNRLF